MKDFKVGCECDCNRSSFVRNFLSLLFFFPVSTILANEIQVEKIDTSLRKKGANLRSGRRSRNLYQVNCAELTECEFPGKDPSYIGDGFCDWDFGCYNTAACGYDGGDCCEDSCAANTSPLKFYDCGMGGYVCLEQTPQVQSAQDEFMEKLKTVSEESKLTETGSPQEFSATFMKLLDPAKLAPDDERFLQRYIMSVFYTSVKNYGQLKVDSSECEWPGVSCNGEGKITQIHLDGLSMTGTIPYEIFYISTLEQINLSNNSLTGELRVHGNVSSSSLANLNFLNLSNNELSGTVTNDDYTYLSQIGSMNLDSNNLSGNLP